MPVYSLFLLVVNRDALDRLSFRSKHVSSCLTIPYRGLNFTARISQDEVDDCLLDTELIIFSHLIRKTGDEVVLVLTQSRCQQRQYSLDPRPIQRSDVSRVYPV